MADFKEQFQGVWAMVSVVNEVDGKKSEPFGANPIGSLILTLSCRYIMVFMQSDIQNFINNNRLKGTEDECRTIAEKVFSMFGTYKIINENEGRVNLFVEGCSFPNWIGTDQERIYTINNDKLIGIVPLGAGNGINTITWSRVK
jgi:hypothetical protein